MLSRKIKNVFRGKPRTPTRLFKFLESSNAWVVRRLICEFSGDRFLSLEDLYNISKGAAYNAVADKHAFEAMKTFFQEVTQ